MTINTCPNCGIVDVVFTVSVAALLVTFPATLLTTTTNCAPLSEEVVGGVLQRYRYRSCSVELSVEQKRSGSGSGNAEGRRLTAGDGLTGRRNHDSGSAWKIGSGATCASCREKAHHADGEQYNQSPKAHNHTSK